MLQLSGACLAVLAPSTCCRAGQHSGCPAMTTASRRAPPGQHGNEATSRAFTPQRPLSGFAVLRSECCSGDFHKTPCRTAGPTEADRGRREQYAWPCLRLLAAACQKCSCRWAGLLIGGTTSLCCCGTQCCFFESNRCWLNTCTKPSSNWTAHHTPDMWEICPDQQCL